MKKAPNKESLSGGEVFVGVDVQVRRGCAYFALSAEGREVYSGWGPESEDPETAAGAFVPLGFPDTVFWEAEA